MVSGRTSYEIVQKAVAAGVPVVAGVSAPTSLAAAAAEQFGVTLAGFLRGEHVNVYSHPERIAAL
jgi:FdhD protein